MQNVECRMQNAERGRDGAAGRMSGMSGRLHDGNCCKSCWYRGLTVRTGGSAEKTGQNRTFPDIGVLGGVGGGLGHDGG